MSTGHENIYDALLAAKLAMGKLVKDAKNPHFKSNYATLQAVHDVAAPALAYEGIVIVEGTRVDGDKVIQHLTFRHIDSEGEISSELPLACKDPNNPQHLGSAQTYARRYLLQTMAGLTPEDDDGNAASQDVNRFEKDQAEKQKTWDRFMAGLKKEALDSFIDKKELDRYQKCIKDKGWKPAAFSTKLKELYEEAGKNKNDATEVNE